jgi:hypothetical protein
MPAHPNFILPPGTQVVSRVPVRGPDGKSVHPRGAVGVVTQSPGDHLHAYRVRFLDGFEAALKRQEISILNEFKREGLDDPLHEFDIYRCVVGSRAYGLDDADSDTDRRGIYLPPATVHWSLFGLPDQLENPDNEECYWELQKFLVMALKANPNVLECLYSPIVETATPLAREMLNLRDRFLSTRVYQTYNGYVASQFKKLESDLHNRGEVKWKHVMHLIRLLLSGITVLREATVPVRVPDDHRQTLRSIKRGQIPWNDINQWRLDLHKQFDAALSQTKLPDRPDYDRVNELLIKARRSMVT